MFCQMENKGDECEIFNLHEIDVRTFFGSRKIFPFLAKSFMMCNYFVNVYLHDYIEKWGPRFGNKSYTHRFSFFKKNTNKLD